MRFHVLYHFTDTRNLDNIREFGGLYSLAELRRQGIPIPAPGGGNLSHSLAQQKGLDCYVHLCCIVRHPMEFVVHQDGSIAETIYLRIDPEIVLWSGVRFAPNNSLKTGVSLYAMDEAVEKNMIDFEVCNQLFRQQDSDEKQKRWEAARRYEILVPDKIPLKFIRNFPCG
ncbi:MAG: DarT ssDNA thymidine ADP-ribosyltransferase family protein [Anaerolineaceae bacterium]|nr:DarT ssDNA thymidine ADP-ribosyltransferase family protein [Anaerolineaceae bacterium]